MSKHDPDVRKLFDKMRTLGWNKKINFVTPKARPMTQSEIEAANRGPKYIDYLGMI